MTPEERAELLCKRIGREAFEDFKIMLRHARAEALEEAWDKVNACGGYHALTDEQGRAYNEGIKDALNEIEKLGGRDPLARRRALKE